MPKKDAGIQIQSPFSSLIGLKDAIASNKKEKDQGKKEEKSVPHLSEEELFRKAMEGVIPIEGTQKKIMEEAPVGQKRQSKNISASPAILKEDTEALAALSELVSGKSSFPLEHTSEYVEEERLAVIPDLSKRLHQGAFSVQAYIDLHGMDEIMALDACRNFIQEALFLEKKCVAIIHGRGLSSPRGPVLKKAVHKWLKTGPYRRHIMAMSSAPSWDGGTGVTYVLLRTRPARRIRKKKARNK